MGKSIFLLKDFFNTINYFMKPVKDNVKYANNEFKKD